VADPRLVPADKCGHCGCETSRPSVPAARTSAADDHWRSERRDLDEIGDDESWLWRLVDEADRVFAAAPPAPDAQRLAAAERTHAQATAFEDRIQMQIRAAVAALAARLSWLHPSHRAAVARQLDRDRATAVIAAVQRRRAVEVRGRLSAQAAARAAYLHQHRVTVSAGRNARAELLLVIDDLIDGYARLAPPPAWFRYGIGVPQTSPDWLDVARAAVAARRRTRMSALHERYQ